MGTGFTGAMGKKNKYKVGDPFLESNSLEGLMAKEEKDDIRKKGKNQRINVVDAEAEAKLFALAMKAHSQDSVSRDRAIEIAQKLPTAGAKKIGRMNDKSKWGKQQSKKTKQDQKGQLKGQKIAPKQQQQQQQQQQQDDGGNGPQQASKSNENVTSTSTLTERKKRNYAKRAERKKAQKRKRSGNDASSDDGEPVQEEPGFGETSERPPTLAVGKRQQKGKTRNSKPLAYQKLLDVEQEKLRQSVVNNYRQMRASKGAPCLVSGH